VITLASTFVPAELRTSTETVFAARWFAAAAHAM
jgi:hypothetical protein